MALVGPAGARTGAGVDVTACGAMVVALELGSVRAAFMPGGFGASA
ncbi:MAG TPA: hypothetical protein VLJ38_04940 [Polyangiaceae bacterium]|nr:hypothetical protein [Polyangiaceae bacterium]